MLVDLLQVRTRDGVRLDGMYQTPAAPGTGPLDAVVCVHGTGSNFYGSTLFDVLAESLLPRNVGVLRINTRGHDLMSVATTTRGGARLGAAYEMLDDCRADIAAWVDWLKGHIGPRIGLIGHSSGAVKCLYSAAQQTELTISHLVAISPPRLSYSWFKASDVAREFIETYDRARALVDVGEPGTLLDVRIPMPFVITAAGYVEKYGPDERYNFLNFIDALRCPTLATFGELELAGNMAFRGSPEAIAILAPHINVTTIAGADHFYSNGRADLMTRICQFLEVSI